MRYFLLILCFISSIAVADDLIDIKLVKSNDAPMNNIRLNVSDNFKLDSNTKIDDNSLFKGKYDSDVGAIYKFSEVDSFRFSFDQHNESIMTSYRHRF